MFWRKSADLICNFNALKPFFTPNDDVFVFIMPLHGCSFLPHQIVVDILVVSKPKPDVRKAKKDSSNANKKRRQDNNTERRTRKVVVRPVRGHKRPQVQHRTAISGR